MDMDGPTLPGSYARRFGCATCKGVAAMRSLAADSADLRRDKGGHTMPDAPSPALRAADAPPQARPSGYPADLAAGLAGREKRPLGELFGLGNFGVNLTRLAPGRAPRSTTGTQGRTSSSMCWKARRCW